MAKCIKYYEGKGFQLAKSEFGRWFVRKRVCNHFYGWQWTKWTLFTDKIQIKKTSVEYENMNGNEIKELIIHIYKENGFDYLDLVNGEIKAYRESGFRLPDFNYNDYKLEIN